MSNHGHQQADAAIRSLIQQLQTAWNAGDAAAWAAVFTEDARFVTLRGDVFSNRQEIEDSHRRIFEGFYKGSHNGISVESLTFPAPDTAVAYAMHEVTGYAALPPGIPASEAGMLRARMLLVAVRHGERWAFVAAENVAIFPKPAVAPGIGSAPKP